MELENPPLPKPSGHAPALFPPLVRFALETLLVARPGAGTLTLE
jgi:hypothetical protein